MNESRLTSDLARLPSEPVDRLTHPFGRFLRIETLGGVVLLVAALISFVLSNSPWAHTFAGFWESPVGLRLGPIEFVRSLREWINDALMTGFFFLVAVELKRELVLGELSNARIAALSIAGALGGMIMPATLYLLLQAGQAGGAGWGTVMATDTAFVIGCLALLGRRVPPALGVFMLSLAIVDDIGAILVVAVGYSEQIAWLPVAFAVVCIAGIAALAWVGVRSMPAYFVMGVLVWLAIDASGIHATIAGVILGLLTPARRWVSDERLYAILDKVVAHPDAAAESGDTKDRETLQVAAIAARETLPPVERIEIALHPWVSFVVMPVFALANAGLPIAFTDLEMSLTTTIFFAFVVGKPAGILTFCWLAVRTGIAVRPPGLSWGVLAGGSVLGGIGFTMALFIAGRAFDQHLIDSAKAGIFAASVVSGALGLALLAWVSRSDSRC
ncbi:Na(+)/H(+) antiporter NhaA [Steroidobacter agaridevorans]|uniref:Na(+)/H(+) antiporter NhaA n=1 Tax=Steroidobacter agaridevorans TaxID=2695856 RepID=A0A829YAA9_9GAMM|nr:Na+/H+ antiporter NhaA [Steroidobacter agaridevorans]GFE80249.1 Na(+)/H(+) antiporter NhaA [Steroidobacter agaridevorans]GFE87236.1 Na(+)/H(+) antiporter NhaA [Steroidobacter agaridevorans]